MIPGRWISRTVPPGAVLAIIATWVQPVGGIGPAAKTAKPAAQPAVYRSYCAVYCLYRIMQFFGTKYSFSELLKTRYIGSRQGSSIEELARAAKEVGLFAEVSP